MSIVARIAHHEKLMHRMAERAGADLDLALQTGAVTPGEVREGVLACTGCTDPEACREWLEADKSDTPGYCRNAEMITSLAELLAADD